MDDNLRNNYFELIRLRDLHAYIWYGCLKVKVKAVESRGTRIFITLEEENGLSHDYDKEIRDIPAFLSRLKFNIEKETAEIDVQIHRKPPPINKIEDDVITVWRIKGVAQYIVFSRAFSAGDYLKKNTCFRFANSTEKKNAVYLIPEKNKKTYYNITVRAKERYGLFCRDVAEWFKDADKYLVEIVELAGQNVLKLVKKI